MISLIVPVLLVVLWMQSVLCQSSPCPETFYYESDSWETHGVVVATDPPPYGSVMNLRLDLSISAHLPTDYVGKIEMYDKSSVLSDIRSGRPIRYRVRFPLTSPLPVVVRVTFDGRVLCTGRPAAGQYTTSITLHHTYRSGGAVTGNDNYNPVEDAPGDDNSLYQPYFNNVVLDRNQWNDAIPNSASLYPKNPFLNRLRPVINANNPNYAFSGGPVPTTNSNPNANWFPRTEQRNPVVIIPTRDNLQPNNSVSQNRPLYSPEIVVAPPNPSPTLPKTYQECGTSKHSLPLIMGGSEANRDNWPWLVALYQGANLNWSFRCGATLVSDRVVVTAAHCVTNGDKTTIDTDTLLLRLGVYNVDDWSDTLSVNRTVSDIRTRDYSKTRIMENDIAGLIMELRVTFSDNIRPACLWSGSDDQDEIEGRRGYVVGWGKDQQNTVHTPEPRMLEVPIVSTLTCRGSNPKFFGLTSSTTFCAGSRNGNGPCRGDSGGGLYLRQSGRWAIRGIVSMSLKDSKNNCDLMEYVVFTDCSKYNKWLTDMM